MGPQHRNLHYKTWQVSKAHGKLRVSEMSESLDLLVPNREHPDLPSVKDPAENIFQHNQISNLNSQLIWVSNAQPGQGHRNALVLATL